MGNATDVTQWLLGHTKTDGSGLTACLAAGRSIKDMDENHKIRAKMYQDKGYEILEIHTSRVMCETWAIHPSLMAELNGICAKMARTGFMRRESRVR